MNTTMLARIIEYTYCKDFMYHVPFFNYYIDICKVRALLSWKSVLRRS